MSVFDNFVSNDCPIEIILCRYDTFGKGYSS